MQFLFKLTLIVALLGGGSYYAVKHIPSLRERAIEIIDPTVKAERLTVELRDDIAELSKTLESDTATQQIIAKAKELAKKAEEKAMEIAELQNQDPGYIRTEIGNFIEKIASTPSPSISPAPITTELPQYGEVLCVPVEKKP